MSRPLSESKQRAILYLWHTTDLNHRQIAESVGCGHATVSVIIRRGRVIGHDTAPTPYALYGSKAKTGTCPTCHRQVALPCLACYLERLEEARRRIVHENG